MICRMAADDANPLLNSLIAARNMLRDCYWWRAMVSESTPWTEAQAQDRIYFDELPPSDSADDYTPDEMDALRPFALAWLDINGALQLRADSSSGCCWVPSGSVIFQLEMPVPEAYSTDTQGLANYLHQRIGRIIRTCDATKPGLADLSGIAGYLPLKHIIYRGYVRTDVKSAVEIGDCVRCELELQWGSDA